MRYIGYLLRCNDLEFDQNQSNWLPQQDLDITTLGKRSRIPLQPQPLRQILQATQQLNRPDETQEILNSLLELDPSDGARIHFQLAEILEEKD